MALPSFYDLDDLQQVAVNLFYGWGFNFYRAENQLRTDDQMVREKTGWLLGLAREAVQTQLAAYRRAFLPLPTRDKPLPDASAVEAAHALEDFSTAIGRLEGTIRSLPVPETDRMTQRFREEAPTLLRLRDHDTRLVGRAQMLLDLLAGRDHAWLLAHMAELRNGLALIAEDVQGRQALLKI